MSAMSTRAPASASEKARERPTPLPPPVMTTRRIKSGQKIAIDGDRGLATLLDDA